MRQEKLSTLLDISIGRTPSRNKSEYWGEGYPWVSIRDLNSKTITDTKEQITDIGVKEARCKLVKKGTLLFSFKLTIGKMAFAGCDLFTNEAIAAFAIKNESELNPEYLYYALQSATYGGSNQAVMGKTLNLKSLAEIVIPLPPINDQIRIAHLLGKVEGLITQRKQHLQQLDDLLKSVFLEIFGDPVRNEKGWEKPELKAFGKISTGNTPPRKEPSNYDGDFIEWIKTDNIPKDAMYISPAAEHLSEKGSQKARTLKKGALLVACIAGSIESIGRAALTDRPVAFNQQINAIQPAKDVNPLYLYGLFKLSRAYIQSSAAKGMKNIITKGDFEKITFIKPPIELQNQFATIVEKVETLKSRYQKSLTDLESLYGAFSQQAFKGELDLSQIPFPEADITAKVSEAPEQLEVTIDVPRSINLPNTDYLLDALTDSSLRKRLLADWLESYCQQIGNAPFSANDFLTAAQTRISELHPDAEFELTVEDYDHIKNWVFEALNSGRLQQEQNVTGQDADGKLLLGNLVELKARTKP
ncbi:restriction endonuclease subunit S [Vibrio cholerae]